MAKTSPMSTKKLLSSVLMVMAILVSVMLLWSPVEGVVTCDTVVSDLAPCIGAVQGGALTRGCCSGIQSLYTSAATTQDRQSVCNCLKTLAARFPGANIGAAAALPQKCGIKLPYQISPSVDCSRIH